MEQREIEILSQKEVQDFIKANELADPHKLLLKTKTLFEIPSALIADQIIAHKKISGKAPFLFKASGIVYPPSLNLEQSSSEATARLKAELVTRELTGKISRMADLTGGFGIDSFFLSQLCVYFDFVEPNESLLSLVRHNFKVLGRSTIQFHSVTAEDFLKHTDAKFDLIYLDPSRRDTGNRKVFKLADCTPNLSEIQNLLFDLSQWALIKTSPLLDIAQGLKEICFVKKIIVVSVDNDCKELLFLCNKNFTSPPCIETINLQKNGRQTFSFEWNEEASAIPSFSKLLPYLYEPNASILKSGCFKWIGEKFNLKKIHPNTHLYTSDNWVKNFPGRTFKVLNEKPDALKDFPERKANVITRNYPLKPEELKKKLKLIDGGDLYLIAFSGLDRKYTVLASRVE